MSYTHHPHLSFSFITRASLCRSLVSLVSSRCIFLQVPNGSFIFARFGQFMLWLVLHDEHSAFDIAQISSLKSHQITSAIAKTAFFVVVSKRNLHYTWTSPGNQFSYNLSSLYLTQILFGCVSTWIRACPLLSSLFITLQVRLCSSSSPDEAVCLCGRVSQSVQQNGFPQTRLWDRDRNGCAELKWYSLFTRPHVPFEFFSYKKKACSEQML